MTVIKPKARRGRPPKVDRAFTDTREALLRSGMEMLTEQGFVATGIDTVLKRVNVPKGSFYNYFGSKETFGQEVLKCYATYFARKLDYWLLNESVSPLQRISNFVEDAKAGMIKYQFRRGCLVGNLGQEITVLPDSFRWQLERILLDWQQRLAACLSIAAQNGHIDAGSDCDELAAYFWIGWEGAILRSKLTQDVQPMDTFFKGFLAGIQK
ncbi:TetR/AcrR family transcriptional regulator [Denitrificimonas sp. JX-1]|uniref:TetR/AcrR family transcriptional regulator n=1 Tax=Denitrificimonas halotolerans TaxID=3098930 RepID=A0ABU5GNA3_9GAMM|nr:TetR/AcrR family transcriptional regulator [Denitrificimonas sp. JX-1]MDY7218007.1 TetR/AcrR family transcriptional regulator [Denitrificimonas sp. JX-1]